MTEKRSRVVRAAVSYCNAATDPKGDVGGKWNELRDSVDALQGGVQAPPTAEEVLRDAAVRRANELNDDAAPHPIPTNVYLVNALRKAAKEHGVPIEALFEPEENQ